MLEEHHFESTVINGGGIFFFLILKSLAVYKSKFSKFHTAPKFMHKNLDVTWWNIWNHKMIKIYEKCVHKTPIEFRKPENEKANKNPKAHK